MKKLLCACPALLSLITAAAQYPLNDTVYYQHFDTLSSGLPACWYTEVNATTVKRGITAKFIAVPGTDTRWNSAGSGFKNVASANSFPVFSAATATLQQAASDRALAIRQTSAFGDPGAAFLFRMDHTYRSHDFKMEFRLQSLDTAVVRKTTWLLQYGLGAVPDTFITVASGVTGSGYDNNLRTVSFGTVLDHHAVPVFIRLVTLAPSTGTGSRAVAAIDDVQLRWKGMAMDPSAPVPVAYYPEPAAKHALHGSILSVQFNRQISTGTSGAYLVTDETDRSLQSFPATAAVAAGTSLKLAGVLLRPGHTYHVTYDALVADTAGFYVPALEDTTVWRFTVDPSVPAAIKQDFDTACAKGLILPANWSRYSASGAEQWHCENYAAGNSCFAIYGHDGMTYNANEDWLISPLLDLSSADITGIGYSSRDSGTGNPPDILLSADYAGSGDPAAASWLTVAVSPASGGSGWKPCIVTIPAADRIAPVHLAIRYRSDHVSGRKVQLDSLVTLIRTGITEQQPPGYGLRVTGMANPGQIDLDIAVPNTASYTIELLSITGQVLYREPYQLQAGHQNIRLSPSELSSGTYVICIRGLAGMATVKCTIR